jgi:hypothetical protein
MAVMKPAVVGCLPHAYFSQRLQFCKIGPEKVDTHLAFCNGLFDLLNLDLAHAFDLVECLACGSMDRLL